MCFGILLTPPTLQIIFKSIMTIPVTQLTVEEAHKEFNSLADKIGTKYEQLDGGKFEQLIPQHLMPNHPNGQVSLLI